ncbi:MAG TPA: hypothetical protein VF427_01985, partial [Noviherbaspirillum sp.]
QILTGGCGGNGETKRSKKCCTTNHTFIHPSLPFRFSELPKSTLYGLQVHLVSPIWHCRKNFTMGNNVDQKKFWGAKKWLCLYNLWQGLAGC